MSDQERPDIIIQDNTAIWEMKVDGDIHGTYMGKFRFRCYLTPTQKIAADREYRQMLGDNPTTAPEHESFLAYSLTQLKYRVLEAPPFWSSTQQTSIGAVHGDLPDENVLSAVLDAAISAEVKYKAQLKKRKEEALDRAKKAAERLLKGRDEQAEE